MGGESFDSSESALVAIVGADKLQYCSLIDQVRYCRSFSVALYTTQCGMLPRLMAVDFHGGYAARLAPWLDVPGHRL